MDAGHEQAGCVLWCERRARLLWTDIPAATLCSYEPGTGRTRRWPMPEPVRAFALTGSDDRLLLAFASSLAFYSFSSGKVQRIHVAAPHIEDGRCDRQGRFVFGTAGEGMHRLNLDLSLERLPLEHAATAHGICFSPDGRRMYFADASGDIRFAHYNPCSAEVGAVRSFVAANAAPGVPMGATVDAEGYVWSVRRGARQVMRFAPDGWLDRVIGLDAPQPCCLAFGGPDLSTLYATPSLQVLAPNVHGLSEPRFFH
jgi:L-arabinonolactonase